MDTTEITPMALLAKLWLPKPCSCPLAGTPQVEPTTLPREGHPTSLEVSRKHSASTGSFGEAVISGK